MLKPFEYEIIINREIHNPKLIVDDFDMLADGVRNQLIHDRNPDWRIVFPYKNAHFDIWEARNDGGTRYIIIAITKSLISTHLKFNQRVYSIAFWDSFPSTLKEIIDTMIVTEVQST